MTSWLHTRESSTLVIATVLTTASLLLLTILPEDEYKPSLDDIILIGLIFAADGLAYRQLTVWTIDRAEQSGKDISTFKCAKSAFIREFLLLLFLAIPIGLWAQLGLVRIFALNSFAAVPAIMLSVIIAIVFTGIDWYFRGCYQQRPRSPSEGNSQKYRLNNTQLKILLIALGSGVFLALAVASADIFSIHLYGNFVIRSAILAYAYVSFIIGGRDYVTGKQLFKNKNVDVAFVGVGSGIFVTEWSVRLGFLILEGLGIPSSFLE